MVPFLDNGVVGSRTEVEKSVYFCAAHLVSKLTWCTVNSHRRDSVGTTALSGGDVLHSTRNVAVIAWRTDEDPCESGGGPSHTKGEGKVIQSHVLIFSSVSCIGFRATLRADQLSLKQNRK